MDYSDLSSDNREQAAKMAPLARVSFGPQWDSILNMLACLTHSTDEQRIELMSNHDVEHTMARLSADYNLLEAAVRDETVRHQVMHVALVTHGIADSMELNDDVAEMICSSVRAVCMRHTIGENGFSDEDYAALTFDWSRVFSPV